MSLAYEAMTFAREVHKDQRRKYTLNPYVDHLAEVAGIVAAAGIEFDAPAWADRRDIPVAVAWLHDTIEDCEVHVEQLAKLFGRDIAAGVYLLSDLELGNRAARKDASRQRLAAAPGWIQSIKCADLISNTTSIEMHDPKFAVVYLEEKRLLLDVLTKADPRLLALARASSQSAGK